MHLFMQVIWGDTWKFILEKNYFNAANATFSLFGQAFRRDIWKIVPWGKLKRSNNILHLLKNKENNFSDFDKISHVTFEICLRESWETHQVENSLFTCSLGRSLVSEVMIWLVLNLAILNGRQVMIGGAVLNTGLYPPPICGLWGCGGRGRGGLEAVVPLNSIHSTPNKGFGNISGMGMMHQVAMFHQRVQYKTNRVQITTLNFHPTHCDTLHCLRIAYRL